MRKTFLLVAYSLMLLAANGQITKGNWLVGGNGTFSSTQSQSASVSNTERTLVRVEPNLGYFLVNKLGGGLRGVVQYEKSTIGNNPSNKQTYVGIGPFLRYYFLKPQNIVNLFSESSIQFYVVNPGNQTSHTLSVMGGVVAFLNSSVGVEMNWGIQEQNTTMLIPNTRLST